MPKIKLLYHPDKWSDLHSAFLESLWDHNVERIPIDATASYSATDHIVFTHVLDTDWTQEWIQQGFRVIVDNTWESHTVPQIPESAQVKHLYHFDWHRVVEPIWYQTLGYTSYEANPCIDKSFLMLMHLKKPHRTAIYESLKPVLDTAIYSYVGAGVPLQNSIDCATTDQGWQRYINKDWYDRTAFSLVVETHVNTNETNHKPWLSEKIYKPIAFEHLFVVWAAVGFLQSLRSMGFKTFAHVIDESYDLIEDNAQRLSAVCDVVKDLVKKIQDNPEYLRTSETIDILRHNRELFYRRDLVDQDFKSNIIDKIQEFFNE